MDDKDFIGIVGVSLAVLCTFSLNYSIMMCVRKKDKENKKELQKILTGVEFYQAAHVIEKDINYINLNVVVGCTTDTQFRRDPTSLFLPEYESFFEKHRKTKDFREAFRELLLEPLILQYI